MEIIIKYVCLAPVAILIFLSGPVSAHLSFFIARLQFLAEIAVGRSFHDRFIPFEINVGIVSGAKISIVGATQKMTNIPQTHFFVYFGMKILGEVKIHFGFILFQHLNFQSVLFCPVGQNVRKILKFSGWSICWGISSPRAMVEFEQARPIICSAVSLSNLF